MGDVIYIEANSGAVKVGAQKLPPNEDFIYIFKKFGFVFNAKMLIKSSSESKQTFSLCGAATVGQ